jgi:hypothetical protein
MSSERLFLTISNNLLISRTKLNVFPLIFVDWEGCSAALLHSRSVQRGRGPILRILSPNFALSPKLQHHLKKVAPARLPD